jgi:hypothetical protein
MLETICGNVYSQGWKNYHNSNLKVKFSIPTDWKVEDQKFNMNMMGGNFSYDTIICQSLDEEITLFITSKDTGISTDDQIFMERAAKEFMPQILGKLFHGVVNQSSFDVEA